MDQATFTEILREHGGLLGRIAATYESRPAQRQDLAQEIAIAIWRALPSFRGDGSVRAFLARIAHNRGVNHVIAQKKDHTMTDIDHDLSDRLPDPRPVPEAATAAEQTRQRLRAAVQTLPLAQRQAVSLALEGFSHVEIAAILGLEVNTVDVRFARARQALRQLLEERHEQVG